jgi:DNA processing protein
MSLASTLELTTPESFDDLLSTEPIEETAAATPDHGMHACDDCLRRSWLMSVLTGYLDARRYDLQRLTRLLALTDGDLMTALNAHKREDLNQEYEEFDPRSVRLNGCTAAVCKHDQHYPYMLSQVQALGAPAVLYLAGDVEHFKSMFAEPAVAIMGIRKATDYGIEIARSMARDLTAAGVPVISAMSEGIPAASHLGALDAGGPTLTVMPGAVDVCYPANRRALYQTLQASGCAISELPCGCRPRRWCFPARNRIVTGLAQLVVVIEADKTPVDLMTANFAKTLGKTVAAVPGRVTSSSSRGSHTLITEGARLVEGAQDVLDLLYGVGARHVPPPGPELEPALQAILEKVGAGHDTVGKLSSTGLEAQEALMAVTELELMGKLTRGDGGRYVLCSGLGVTPR